MGMFFFGDFESSVSWTLRSEIRYLRYVLLRYLTHRISFVL